jgi:hypothetical protein
MKEQRTKIVKFVFLNGRELRAASAAITAFMAVAESEPELRGKTMAEAFKMCICAIGDIPPDACIQVYDPPVPVYHELVNIDRLTPPPAKELKP